MDGAKSLIQRVERVVVRILILFSLLTVFACKSEPVEEMEIPGTYLAKYPNGVEELILGLDGTYEETFTFNLAPSGHFGSVTGASYRNSGRWNYEIVDGESYVTVESGMIAPIIEPPVKSDRTLKARRPDGASEGVVLDAGAPDGDVLLTKR